MIVQCLSKDRWFMELRVGVGSVPHALPRACATSCRGQVVQGRGRGRGQCPTRAAARLRNVMRRTGDSRRCVRVEMGREWPHQYKRCHSLAGQREKVGRYGPLKLW